MAYTVHVAMSGKPWANFQVGGNNLYNEVCIDVNTGHL